MTLRVISWVGLWAVVVGCSGDVSGGGPSGTAGSTGAGGAGSGGRGAGGTAGSGNNCSFTPCGGDIVGSWTATTACGFAAASQAGLAKYPACAGAIKSATVGSFAMTATFSTDGTYSTAGSGAVSVTMGLTGACFSQIAGTTVTMDATICQTYQSSLAQQPGTSGASCTFASSTCTCQFTVTSTLDQTGTYSVAGSTITMTTDGTASSGSFCVQGTTLQLEDSTGVVTVLQRQS